MSRCLRKPGQVVGVRSIQENAVLLQLGVGYHSAVHLR